eukprot:g45466.t1
MGDMYRPPNSNQDVGYKIHQEIEKACKKGKVTVIIGDFSMQVDWEIREKLESDVMGLQLNKHNYRGMREELARIDQEKGPDPKSQLSYSSDAAWPAVFLQLHTV